MLMFPRLYGKGAVLYQKHVMQSRAQASVKAIENQMIQIQPMILAGKLCPATETAHRSCKVFCEGSSSISRRQFSAWQRAIPSGEN